MNTTYSYDKEKNILYVDLQGEASLAAFDNIMKRITLSSEYPPDIDSIWSLHNLDLSSLGSNFERSLIYIRKTYPERAEAKIAIISIGDLAYGLSNMYKTMSKNLPQTMAIFRNQFEAEEWIQGEP